MSNSALLIMAHGSRKQSANNEFKQFVQQLRAQAPLSLKYTTIDYCFLELAEPDLLTAIVNLKEQQCTHIDLYPLFFHQGNHIARDIPQQIEQAKAHHPDVTIEQLEYFGMNPTLGQSVIAHIDLQRAVSA